MNRMPIQPIRWRLLGVGRSDEAAGMESAMIDSGTIGAWPDGAQARLRRFAGQANCSFGQPTGILSTRAKK